MKNTSVELSIVIPIYNESSILLELHRRLRAAAEQITTNYELIFVNDGSKDDSLNGLKELARSSDKTHFISFSRNFGHQIAVSAGLDHAKGNAIVIIDGDLQDPPELIPALYKKYKEGYQVVYAKRKSRQGESFFKKITAKLFYRILSKITSIDIPLDTGDFRLIDKIVVKNLQKMPERQKFLRGQIAWIGFQQTYVEFERDERKHGETGYTIKKMVQFALDGITAFSDVPLRLVTWAGFTVSFFAFLIIIYALISKFVLNEVVTGWTSMIISVMFIGGVQLVAIGIIGEYLSRINNDVKNRPLYIIQETDVE
ncbi:MAG: glycosyltransferase family 2 protein [Saprospiraceae bacterium]